MLGSFLNHNTSAESRATLCLTRRMLSSARRADRRCCVKVIFGSLDMSRGNSACSSLSIEIAT